MRKKIVAGNWKMNKNATEAVEFINELKAQNLNKDADIVENAFLTKALRYVLYLDYFFAVHHFSLFL